MSKESPIGFKRRKLGEVVSLEYGSALSEKVRTAGRYPVFGSNGVVGTNREYLVEGPGIIVGRKGSVGSVTWTEENFWPIDTTYYVKPLDGHNLRWLFYLLKSQELESLTLKSGVPGLNRADVYRLSIDLPCRNVQAKIVDILSSIDEALEASKAVLEQLRVLFLNLRDNLVLRGLPKWHHAYQTVKRIGFVPLSWNIRLLSACATVQTGIAKGKKYNDSKLVSLPYLRVANVQDGYLDLAEVKTIDVLEAEVDRYDLQYGDVLLTEGGDYDKLGRGHIWRDEIKPCLHQNHIFAVRADRSLLLPEYLNHLTSSSYGKRYFLNNSKQTTNLASINSTQLKSLPCPLPSVSEQAEIVEVLDSIEKSMLLEQERIKAAESVKQGLSKQLLTGQLRVAVDDG